MPDVRTSDGIRIHYEDEGKGPPIVLVHGWTMSGAFFRKQRDALSNTHRCVVPDLRGCGSSESRPGTNTMQRLAHDVHELLERLDLRNVTLVGWSMGGGVSMQYLDAYGSKRLNGIALIDFPPQFQEDPNTADKVCQRLRTDRERFISSFLKRMFFQDPSIEEMAWMVREHFKSDAETACEAYHQLGLGSSKGKHYDLPALLVFPQRGWFAESLPEWQRIFPNHSLPAFSKSRHAPFWEEAPAFNEALKAFARPNPPA